MQDKEKKQGQISEVISQSIEKIKTMAETGTIIGDAFLSPSGATIIPVSRLSVGFLAGGGEYTFNKGNPREDMPMAASTGGGVSLTPVGFLIDDNANGIKFIPAYSSKENDTLITSIANIVANLTNKTNKNNS